MQIQEKDKEIQCIRLYYNPESRSIHQKVIAAFPRYLDSFPHPDSMVALTSDEKEEFGMWWSEQQVHFMANIEKWQAKWAGSTLSSLAKAIRDYRSMTVEEAAAAWSGLTEVASALKSRSLEIEQAQSWKQAEIC